MYRKIVMKMCVHADKEIGLLALSTRGLGMLRIPFHIYSQ